MASQARQLDRDPIVHTNSYLRAMGITHLGDLWRLAPEVQRERWAQFERDVAAGKIPTHGEKDLSTPLRLSNPVHEAFADAEIHADRHMTPEYRKQALKDGVTERFLRAYDRRCDAYIREHELDDVTAGWHVLNELCRHEEDDLRIWSRRVRASRLAHVLQREERRK